MKKTESNYERTSKFKYAFSVYLNDGEKYHSDFYTKEGIEEMRIKLNSKNEMFTLFEVDENNSCIEIR